MPAEWTDMMGYGGSHWIMLAVAIVIVLYPVARILGRMGFSPFLAILAVIPFLNLVALWIVAFIEWPKGGPSAPGAGI